MFGIKGLPIQVILPNCLYICVENDRIFYLEPLSSKVRLRYCLNSSLIFPNNLQILGTPLGNKWLNEN